MASLSTTVAVAAGAVVLGGAALAAGDQLQPFSGSSATTSTVPAPANVEALAVGPDFVKVGWGPTLPGPMTAGAATARSLVINWGPSQDNHGPVTYTFSKNGKVTIRGLTRLWNKVGFTTTVRSFRACVWAVSVQSKSGPPMCATFNAT